MQIKKEIITYTLADKEGTINSPSMVYNTLKDRYDHFQEQIYILSMDNQNKFTVHMVSMGTFNQCIAHPVDIFRTILLNGGCRFILSHNHPSGRLEFSPEDIEFTKKIKKASDIMGIQMLDHILITQDNYLAYSEKFGGL